MSKPVANLNCKKLISILKYAKLARIKVQITATKQEGEKEEEEGKQTLSWKRPFLIIKAVLMC